MRLRIKQSVPTLLVPAGSVVRIELSLTDGENEKRVTIREPATIALICSGLKEVIVWGARIPVMCYSNNPQHELYGEAELPTPWGWFALGIALMATFVYAFAARRRESQ